MAEKYKIGQFQLSYLYGGERSGTYNPGDYIEITVIGADNKVHYSTGIYLILKIDETINSEGYIQNMSLLKNPSSSVLLNKNGSAIDVNASTRIDSIENPTDNVTTSYTEVYINKPVQKTATPNTTNRYNRTTNISNTINITGIKYN